MRKKITLAALLVLLAALITMMVVKTKQADSFYADFSGKGRQPVKAAKLLAKYGESAVWDSKTKTLTMTNVHFSGTGNYVVTLPKDATLELVGKNSITGTAQKSGNAAALVCLGDLTVTGTGSLSLQGCETRQEGISAGMILNGNLLMNGGEINANGGDYGIYAADGSLTMEAKARLSAEGEKKAIEAADIVLAEGWDQPDEMGKAVSFPDE